VVFVFRHDRVLPPPVAQPFTAARAAGGRPEGLRYVAPRPFRFTILSRSPSGLPARPVAGLKACATSRRARFCLTIP